LNGRDALSFLETACKKQVASQCESASDDSFAFWALLAKDNGYGSQSVVCLAYSTLLIEHA